MGIVAQGSLRLRCPDSRHGGIQLTYLLDTHVLIWAGEAPAKLSDRARQILEQEECVVSAVSLWEIAIKRALGRIESKPMPQLVEDIVAAGIIVHPITTPTLTAVADMTHPHRDPFDRFLAADALAHKFCLVTVDKVFSSFPIQTLW